MNRTSATWTIAQKELAGFFKSPMIYFVLTMMSLIMSYQYPIQISQFAQILRGSVIQPGISQMQLNIHYAVFLRHLFFLNLLMMFVVPAITMRLFSEEKKMRTIDLLLTSPVTSAQIVLGKYVAALGAIFALVLSALAYPIATSFFVKLNWAPLLISFGAMFLVGAVYAAMDLFCSSLSEQALVSFITSVILNISIWFIGLAVDVIDSQTIRQVFEHLSLNTHLAGLVEGTIRTSDLIFFASVIVLFVFITERVVESSRWR